MKYRIIKNCHNRYYIERWRFRNIFTNFGLWETVCKDNYYGHECELISFSTIDEAKRYIDGLIDGSLFPKKKIETDIITYYPGK